MMWIVKHIMEADFGCEERPDDEPVKVLVTLESDDGRTVRFEAEDAWLTDKGIDEGDEWPEDIDSFLEAEDKAINMNDFMNNYYAALDEMEEQE